MGKCYREKEVWWCWEPSLSYPPPLAFLVMGQYLPTEKIELGGAVKSNEPARFLCTKFIY